MCVKVVGDKFACVTELCVIVCEDAEADAVGWGRGGADLKTRIPHNFVGKNVFVEKRLCVKKKSLCKRACV